jgi:hypothetical protein
METYRFYPPQVRSTQLPYQLLSAGEATCHHELLEDAWCDRITVQDGILFVTYSCRRCGRQICQSLDEVTPPPGWNGVRD